MSCYDYVKKGQNHLEHLPHTVPDTLNFPGLCERFNFLWFGSLNSQGNCIAQYTSLAIRHDHVSHD